MKLGNLGCGGCRPQGEHWVNVDTLLSILKPGTPEMGNLLKEKNYVDADITKLPLPFPDGHFDGLIASHVCEHLTCHQAVAFLSDCRRILKHGGLLVVSVPDAEYFLKVYADGNDTPEKAVEYFGEPISESWQKSFFDYALFKDDHIQILTHDSLKCLIIKAGFPDGAFHMTKDEELPNCPYPALLEIEKIMNRRKFSVELVAIKSA